MSRKIFFGDLPLPPPPPPVILESGSGTVIYHPNSYNTSIVYAVTHRSYGRAEVGGHKLEHILLLKVH